jgi:hypothetical protein
VPKSRSRRTPRNRPVSQRSPAPPPPVRAAPAPGLRGAVERRSAPALVWLSSRPRLLVPLLSLGLLIGGLVAPVWLAVPMLVLLVLLVGWLTYLSWPAVQGGARVVRVATLVLIVMAIVSKLLRGVV